VIAKWMKEAKDLRPQKVRFQTKEDGLGQFKVLAHQDTEGFTSVFEKPDPKKKYVCAVDPSEGLTDSDWQVATILDVDTAAQVAEMRCKIDPDLFLDQVEGLAFWYNKAYTAVEVTGVGRALGRHLARRAIIPMYERESFDHIGGVTVPVKRIGWETTAKSRDDLFVELRQAVRQERGKIRSVETLKECRTLWLRKIGEHQGRIEARPGCHDDGPMAHGIALIIRNRLAGVEPKEDAEARKGPRRMIELLKRRRERDMKAPNVDVSLPTKIVNIRAAAFRPDGRRSAL
jgi:hypothetical protein